MTSFERRTVPYPPHGSAEWLAVRWADELGNRRQTASTAAAMFGEHQFVTPGDLAAVQLADAPPAPTRPTDAMTRGVELEEPLAQWWARDNDMTVRKPKVLHVCGRCIATIDFELYPTKQSRRPVDDRHLEVKTTTSYIDPDQLPPMFFWQGTAQAYCRGSRIVEWMILDGRLRIHQYTQAITDEALATFAERLGWWMAWIDMGLVPEGVEMTYDNYATWHTTADPDGMVVVPADEAQTYLDLQIEYDSIGAEIRGSEKRRDEIKATFAERMGTAEYLYVADPIGFDVSTTPPIVTWKAGTRTSIDREQLVADGLAEKYERTTDTRTMLVKKPTRASN